MSLIQKTFDTADRIDNNRSLLKILAHTVSEMGELAEEIAIADGNHYKQAGADGVVGEAVDLIVCVLDIIHKHDPTVTEEDLIKIAVRKLAKWESSVNEI